MAADVRRYDNRRRRQSAAATGRRIIDAAGQCFRDHGYAATTLNAVADTADVSVESVKKTMGTKRALLRRWFDQQVAGPEGLPAVERAWLAKLPTTPVLSDRVDAAAAAVTETMGRAATAVAVMTAAAHADPEIARMWADERAARYSDVETIVALVLGDVTPSMPLPDLVDAVYALSEAHTYLVLVDERGWTPDRYRAWFSDTLSDLITGTRSVTDTPSHPT